MDLQFTHIDNLYLDPKNPRLGRHTIEKELNQADLLEEMRAWTLEELAYSYLESGSFWTHEAMLVVEEELAGQPRLIVVEGNRRLAALKYLYQAYDGQPVPRKWQTIVAENPEPPLNLFSQVPYILKDSRQDIQAFLGFRHVTGIKQWGADEKAGFIAKLIEEEGLTYEQVRRKIGSKTPTVRQHYIAYRLLLQMEDTLEDFVAEDAGMRFALLYMSLRTQGTKQYLQIDLMADTKLAKRPVPNTHLKNLANFARWLFGTEDNLPLVTDTRQVSDFGKILESEEAVSYLEQTNSPRFDIAFKLTGGDEDEIVDYIELAASNIALALTGVHRYKKSAKVQQAVKRLGVDALQLLHNL